jgi:crotonobetainyl-CoA:carnitine CoA-transferase CaiB-like acyl-CoA transferase
MSLPLDDTLVLDFSEYIAGPYCGALLSDLGAEVIKVEPLDGAEERRLGNRERYRGNTRMSLTLNRGKKSICIDLRTEQGREIVYRLVTKADVTIQNFAPGAAEKLGIDYETLSSINARLIFISSTAFGDVGPYAQRKGFDLIGHAASGIMSSCADEEGKPRAPGGAAYNDVGTGMLNALGAVAALLERVRSGEGQKIETSLFNTGMTFQAPGLALIDQLDRERYREQTEILRTAREQGKDHTDVIDEFSELVRRYDQPDTTRPVEVPDCRHRPADRHTQPYYRIYETADGYLAIATLNHKQRKLLCDALNVIDQGVDVDAGNVSDELYYHRKEVMKQMEQRFREKTNEEWIGIMEESGVPCGQVNYSIDLYDDPQAHAVGMICSLENSALGPYRTTGHPVRYTKTPAAPRTGAPSLGEHTAQVLGQFGYSAAEIAELRASRVIG